MAEPVGITLGALGVVGLLSVCIDCFDFVQNGRSVGTDFIFLQGDFASQILRFRIWARISGFFDKGGYDRRLDNPEIKFHIRLQLALIALLFMDTNELVERYDSRYKGLRTYDFSGYSRQLPAPSDNDNSSDENLRCLIQRIKNTKSHVGIFGAFRWALKDKSRFETLLQRLKDRIDALYFVTEQLHLFERVNLQQATEIEIESIHDVGLSHSLAPLSTLESLMPTKLISDAASQQLTSIGSRRTNDDDKSSGTETFATAPEEESAQATVETLQKNPFIVPNGIRTHQDDILVNEVLPGLVSEYRKHSDLWTRQELSFRKSVRASEHQAERNNIIDSARSQYEKIITSNPPWVLDKLRQLTTTVEGMVVRLHHPCKRIPICSRSCWDGDTDVDIEYAHLFKIDPILNDDPVIVENVTLLRYVLFMPPLIRRGMHFQTLSLSDKEWGAQLDSIRQLDTRANAWAYARTGRQRCLRRMVNEIDLSGEKFMTTRIVKAQGGSVKAVVTFEGPLQSPYSTGVFQLSIVWGKEYPVSGPPEVRFLTRVYHPNVDNTGKICLDFFDWTVKVVMSRVVMAIISLLSDPEIDDPLVPEIASTYLRSREEYEQTASAYTKKYATLDAAQERLSKANASNWSHAVLRKPMEKSRGLEPTDSIWVTNCLTYS
ncbi:ubiquitin-conjugating enzyme E2 [Apiospora arundinis]|uniref:Ubiquitin-conjugating enzyme E2 n=1 Tax=Apiospora arundinis TaxID=335852 RepID=A0ABR2HZB3_9PEZI